MGLKRDLEEAKTDYEYYRDNKQEIYDETVAKRDNLVIEKQDTLQEMQDEIDLEVANLDAEINTAYAAYQTALAGGNSIDISNTLATYQLKVADKNDYLSAANDRVTRTSYNYDVDIANAQADIDNFEQNYATELNERFVSYINIESEVTSLENELDDMDDEIESLENESDDLLQTLKDAIQEAKENCYQQWA